MTIKVGQTIPDIILATMGAEGPEDISTGAIFKNKKVIMFGVPGAFTPICSAKHLPGFVEHADAIRAKGIDAIVCIAVNDVFVMGAWGQDQNISGKVMLVADGSGKFATAAGLTLDLTERGMGIRNHRFSMLVEDRVVKSLHIDRGVFENTSAEQMLSNL